MTKVRFNVPRIFIEDQFDGIRAFLTVVSEALPEAEGRREQEEVDLAVENGWDAPNLQIVHTIFHRWLPRMLGNSAIISIHSVVETQLMDIARRLQSERKIGIEQKDITGKGIERVKIYLTKLFDLPIGERDGWPRLTDLAAIRNIIVHRAGAQGSSEDQRKKVQDLIKRYGEKLTLDGPKENPRSEIVVSLELCNDFIDDAEAFLLQLIKDAHLDSPSPYTH